jgi:hypothetical protein
VQLEQTLRACVIGPLPPLPPTVAAAAAAAAVGQLHPCFGGGMAAGCLPGGGGGGVLLQGALGGMDGQGNYNLGAPSDMCGPAGGGVTYHPIMTHAPQGPGGLGGVLLGGDGLGGSSCSGSPMWASAPGSGMNHFAPHHPAAAAAAQQPPQQYAPSTMLWQQQQAQQRHQQAQQAPLMQIPVSGGAQHQQALANLHQIQRLRDQLKAAEEAELAQMAHAEAAYSSQQAAAAGFGRLPSGGRILLSSGSGGGGGVPGGMGIGGASSGVDALDGASSFGGSSQLLPDLPPGLQLQSLLMQQQAPPPQQIVQLQQQAAQMQSGGGGSGTFVLSGLGGAGDAPLMRDGSQSGSGPIGSLELAPSAGGGGGNGGGFRLLPAFWGSGSVQSADSQSGSPQRQSGPPATLQQALQPQQRQLLASWPPPAFGSDAGSGSIIGAPAAGMADGVSSWSFGGQSVHGPSGLGSSGSGAVGGVSSYLGSSAGGSAPLHTVVGPVFGRNASGSFCGSVGAAAAMQTAASAASGGATPVVQPSSPLKHAAAGSPAPLDSSPASNADTNTPAAAAASAALRRLEAAVDGGGGGAEQSKGFQSVPLSWAALPFRPSGLSSQSGSVDESGLKLMLIGDAA